MILIFTVLFDVTVGLLRSTLNVILDIERDQVPFICKSLGCRPVASPDHFTPEALATVDNVDELPIGIGNNCLKVIYSNTINCKIISLFSSQELIINQRPYQFSSVHQMKIF